MAKITDVPFDILLLIFTSGERWWCKDLSSLARTCRSLYSEVNPYLVSRNIRQEGSSCLIWAAQNGHLKTMRMALSELGADPNTTGPHRAESHDDLIDAFKYDTRESEERPWYKYGSLLHWAAKGGHDQMVILLLNHGARLDTPSLRVCECKENWHLTGEYKSYTTMPRWLPLHHAVCQKHVSTANILLDRNPSVQLNYDVGEHHEGYSRSLSLLHSAAARGLDTLVQRALDIDPSIAREDWAQDKALHYTSESRDSKRVIDLLIRAGADLEAQSIPKWPIGWLEVTPVIRACQLGNFVTATNLVRAGANTRPDIRFQSSLLNWAVRGRNWYNLKGSPELREARDSEQTALVQTLVSDFGHHADEPVRALPRFKFCRRYQGIPYLCTPLTAAVMGNQDVTCDPFPDGVKILLENGADPNHPGELGRPPLAEVLYRFCDNKEGEAHMTRMQENRQSDCWQVIVMLLGAGARPDVVFYLRDEEHSPLSVATERAVSGGPESHAYTLLKFILENCQPGTIAIDHLNDVLVKNIFLSEPQIDQSDFDIFYDLFTHHGASLSQLSNLAKETLYDRLANSDDGRLSRLWEAYVSKQLYVDHFKNTPVPPLQPHLDTVSGAVDCASRMLDAPAIHNNLDNRLREIVFWSRDDRLCTEEDKKSILADLGGLIERGANPFYNPQGYISRSRGIPGIYTCRWDSEFCTHDYEGCCSAFDHVLEKNILFLVKGIASLRQLPHPPSAVCSWLHWPISNCNWEMVDLLLESGACPNGADGCANPPFLHACCNIGWFYHPIPRKTIQLFLQRGADLYRKNRQQISIISLAKRFSLRIMDTGGNKFNLRRKAAERALVEEVSQVIPIDQW